MEYELLEIVTLDYNIFLQVEISYGKICALSLSFFNRLNRCFKRNSNNAQGRILWLIHLVDSLYLRQVSAKHSINN